MASEEDDPDCASSDLKVIFFAGLRGCGKSLCGRALQNLLECNYLDLDEAGESGGTKFEKFYHKCVQKITGKRGLWIIDKLGPYVNDERLQFLKKIKAEGSNSILLKFVHANQVEELRLCFSRFSRRGVNHRDPASSGEDVFVTIKEEQKLRRGPLGNNFSGYYVSDDEQRTLLDIKEIQIKATPVNMVYQAINILDSAKMIDKNYIGHPLLLFVENALDQSLKVEATIGGKSICLADIKVDNLDHICKTPAPFEDGQPGRFWMSHVRDNSNSFLDKLGFPNELLFHDVVRGEVSTEVLFEIFCSACEATELREHRSALVEWLSYRRTKRNAHRYPVLQEQALRAYKEYLDSPLPS